MKRSVEERFWDKVTKTDTCWLWTGALSRGYGQIKTESRKREYAHRLSYAWTYGPIPDGMEIDHICHVLACVRPEHLRLATTKQNSENLAEPLRNNTSGHRGVWWSKRGQKWRVSVVHNGRFHHGGCFVHLEDAARAAAELRNSLFTHNDADREAS